jgi:hypothetical protein
MALRMENGSKSAEPVQYNVSEMAEMIHFFDMRRRALWILSPYKSR